MSRFYRDIEDKLLQQMNRIEAKLNTLLTKQQRKAFYRVGELAILLDLDANSVRSLCRTGRISAFKAQSGHGRSKEWRISDAELRRIEREGPRPVVQKSTTTVVLSVAGQNIN